MSNDLEAWEIQEEAKHAAAKKGGPLKGLSGGDSFLGGGVGAGVAGMGREVEVRRAMAELAKAAEGRFTHSEYITRNEEKEELHRQKKVASELGALEKSHFSGEIEYFLGVLCELNLTPEEKAEVRDVLQSKHRWIKHHSIPAWLW